MTVAGSGAPMSPLHEITQATADEILSGNDIVFLSFGRLGCPPCRASREALREQAAAHPEIVFGTVDTSAESGLARAFDVKSVPALAVIREQVLLLLHTGVLEGPALEDVIRKAREADMDRIRRDIESENREE